MSGTSDKAEGKLDKVKGNIKEKTGEALGNKELENEGKADRVKGELKEKKGDVKDALD